MTADEQSTPGGGLHIEADLTVGLTSSTLRVQSDNETLYVDARSFDALGELRAAADSSAVDVLRQLGVESPLEIETPVVIRVRGVPVAAYRPGERAGRLAELLGIAPFGLDFGGVVRAAGRRLRPSSSV